MATGIVKWFNPTKGYGFITPEEGGQDVFVHISEVEKAGIHNMNEGLRLSYDISNNRDRQSATNLKEES